MTNAECATTNKLFLKACEMVKRNNRFKDFKPSQRQASKWHIKKGLAWKVANNIEIV